MVVGLEFENFLTTESFPLLGQIFYFIFIKQTTQV